MSFYKVYPNRKDWRKQPGEHKKWYCPNHKCEYCASNKRINDIRNRMKADDKIKSYYKDAE